jgi:hypothetical protein
MDPPRKTPTKSIPTAAERFAEAYDNEQHCWRRPQLWSAAKSAKFTAHMMATKSTTAVIEDTQIDKAATETS